MIKRIITMSFVLTLLSSSISHAMIVRDPFAPSNKPACEDEPLVWHSNEPPVDNPGYQVILDKH